MTQKTLPLSHWFVTDNDRAKARIKYELKQLETQLGKCFNQQDDTVFSKSKHSLCKVLADKYSDYLKLIDVDAKVKRLGCFETLKEISYLEAYSRIMHLKQKISAAVNLVEEAKTIAEISSLYQYLAKAIESNDFSDGINHLTLNQFDRLKQLFKKENLESWLSTLVDIWNHDSTLLREPARLFRNWDLEEQTIALDFFSESEVVNLINAIFFYKLYPDKLFNELIHPEKLVSVRMRLGFLHEFIELLQKQLQSNALQYGLNPGIDFLFHGEELPQGIMIEVNEVYKDIIQSAVKNLKVLFTPENNEKVTLERLHDLGRAYKFWFNPNRLIDAVMVLQQRLVTESISQEDDLEKFQQEMLILYRQLTTTECLDLYGYFANNDSRYLLYTLYSIINGCSLDWLPSLNASEKNAIARVYQALKCVMEALRVELKNRFVTTDPYLYDLGKKKIHTGRRNREAVFRAIAIYGCERIVMSDSLERLFNLIEEPNKQL
ncbi:TPA: hypothetical protein ACJXEA_003097 [Legionella pneumophila subsp. fraseri]|nr:hypothetical protein [Legionella pneumophila]HBD9374068.1 hypothetical protein [Legionella pneumophila]HDV6634124.1 hypothetical protein [Legionella pneumophila]